MLESNKGTKVSTERAHTRETADVNVDLSQHHLGPEQIDRARVEEVRTAILNGQLEINPEQIAQGLISDTLAFLGAEK